MKAMMSARRLQSIAGRNMQINMECTDILNILNVHISDVCRGIPDEGKRFGKGKSVDKAVKLSYYKLQNIYFYDFGTL